MPEGGTTSLADWVEWALRQADRLDPFTPSPRSILDDEQRIEQMRERSWSDE